MLTLCVVSRMFVTEHHFRVPPLSLPWAISQSRPGYDHDVRRPAQVHLVNHQDLSRATHAMVLLAACGLWLVGGAVGGCTTVRHKWLVALVAALACCSLVSALRATDSHGAMLIWWEQLAIMSAGVLAAQVFADRRRLRLLLCVLAAGAATVAAKGLLQVYDEFPAHAATLKATPGLLEEVFGRREHGATGRLLRLRLGAMTPTGFFKMSNVLASLLLVTGAAAVGLLAERVADLAAAVAKRRRGKADADVSSPMAAAIVCIIPAALAAVVLVMTRSAGAIGAAVLAGAAGVVVAVFRRRLRRHWRAAVLAAAVAGIAAAAATVGYGISHDRLPTKTMTVRWYYWTASADIIRDEPLWGVGGGGFGDAYLLRRRAEAEESVKDPHNVAVSAAARYGLIGGAAYLAALAYVLIGVCRPRQHGPAPPTARSGSSNGVIACAAVAIVLLARGIFGGGFAGWAPFVWQAAMPAALFALVLAGLCLAGRGAARSSAARLGRIAPACGVAAFAVHNMVSFSLWAPATATVFWVAAGALLANGASRGRPIMRARWPAAAAGAAVVVAAAVLLWQPIWVQTARWRQVNKSLRVGDVDGALSASAAAAATWDDPVSTAAAAGLRMALAGRAAPADQENLLRQAMTLADRASRQLPTRAAIHGLAGDAARAYAVRAHDNDAANAAVDHASRAVQLDPMSMDSRLVYAEMLSGVGRHTEALDQLQQIEFIDGRLAKDSVYRLTRAQRDRISRLRAESSRE